MYMNSERNFIMRMHDEGASTKVIAEALTANGFRTRTPHAVGHFVWRQRQERWRNATRLRAERQEKEARQEALTAPL
jgi:hypothetical protein